MKRPKRPKRHFQMGPVWMPGLLPTDAHQYNYGTIHGLCYHQDSWLVILAVVNERKGNGHFKELFDLLEQEHDVRVVGFLNPALLDHFVEDRGYQRVMVDGQEAVEHRKQA